MDCDFAELLSPFHDNELAEDRAAVLRVHLETCAACRAELQALVDLGAALRAERDAVPAPNPAEQLGALTEVLTSARAPLWRRRVAVPVPILGGLVAATLALVVVVTAAARDRPASPAPPLDPGGRLTIEVVKRPVDGGGGTP